GLMTVHNALVGAGLRDQIKVGASGKVSTGVDIVKRLIQGADFTNAARALIMAAAFIPPQTCHRNTCPVGVAPQDTRHMRALDVPDKAERVRAYQYGTVVQSLQIVASMGLRSLDELAPSMLRRRTSGGKIVSYAELFEHLGTGQLLREPPKSWRRDWELA